MKNQVKKIEDYPDILTLAEACEIHNCHLNTLRNWDNKGLLKAILFDTRNNRRYKKEDVLKIINQKH